MERPLVGGAVAEETDDHLAGAQHLLGERCTDGDGHRTGDDAVGAQVATGHVGDVHRTAAATAVAGVLLEQFGHHRYRIGAVCQRVSVAAVCRGDEVAVLESRAHPLCHGFLAD